VKDISKPKAEVLRDFLFDNTLYDQQMITAIVHKFESKEDFSIIDTDNSLNIIATDNMASKRLIAENVKHFVLIGCEKDLIEIRNYLDQTDMEENMWNETNGYASTQNFLANLFASSVMKFILSSDIYLQKLERNEHFKFLNNVPNMLKVIETKERI
jgi:hypothetical protein